MALSTLLVFSCEWLFQPSSQSRLAASARLSTFFFFNADPVRQRAAASNPRNSLSCSCSVDLFSKDFIFVPIHDALHWSLAIICFPGEVISPAFLGKAEKDPALEEGTRRAAREDSLSYRPALWESKLRLCEWHTLPPSRLPYWRWKMGRKQPACPAEEGT